MSQAKNFRRLRRAFLYHFVLQVRFWLQREANAQQQSRSSSAISAQTFAVNLFFLRLRRYFGHFSKNPSAARSAAARSARSLPCKPKEFRACGVILAISPRTKARAQRNNAPSAAASLVNLIFLRHERCAASGSGDVAVPAVRSERFRRGCFSCGPSGAQRMVQSRTGSCHRFALNRP